MLKSKDQFEGNIFESKKERELQRLRQQLASNVVKVDPNLKGYLDRFDPDVSRATLLRLQRQKIPTKEELEKLAGVKTAKKLKGRRGKNLRGEVGRAIREQKRFEKGERRYRPEEEPRIVGEPAPQPLRSEGGFTYDPEVEKERIRVKSLIENRRLDLEGRQLEINKLLADRERGERQRQFNLENPIRQERLDIEGRQLQALLDRQADDRDRFEEDIRQRKKERRLQRDLQSRALETEEFRTETIAQQAEQKLRVYDELKRKELDLLERRLDLDTQRALRSEADPITEGLSQADREFLQRGFERGLETLERRFGENEALIQEQIRTHADRVGRQKPVEIKLVQPQAQQKGQQTGPSAQEIASSVRDALKEYKIQSSAKQTFGSPRRRLEIEEVSEEEEPIAELLESPRPTPVQTPTPSPRPLTEGGLRLKKAAPTPLTAEEIAQPREGLFESAELVDPRNLPQEGLPETERREPEPEEPEELFQSGVFAGGLEAAAQNAIGFVGDVAGRAAEGIAGLFEPEIGEQTGGRLDPEGQVFGLGQEIEVPRPTIQPVPSAEPERRPPVLSPQAFGTLALQGGAGRPPPASRGIVEEVEEEEAKIEALQEGEGLIEEEVQAVIQPSEMNTNLRLFESMEGEIDAYYTRGRAQGGARGDLPFIITNLTDKTFKGLAPGQSVVLSQIEKDGRLGYFPGSRVRGEKIGITRINRDVLRKQIKSGKLKVDRSR